jgi:hypothetical protein
MWILAGFRPRKKTFRIIPHRGVDHDCGSLEVWFADERKSVLAFG